MKQGFRQSMAWVHTWAGLSVCWLLLLIFAAGTASYYRAEISLWMRPELHSAAANTSTQSQLAERAIATLQQRDPHAAQWFISFPTARTPWLYIFWEDKLPLGVEAKSENYHEEKLDPNTGDLLAQVRETKGGDFFYRMHFDLHYIPVIAARWMVGFCAMFMLMALLTGVVIHRRIFKDFFTFRPRKGQRSWLDAHNVTGVLALPYHLMITYTGLMLLMYLYMPSPIAIAYHGDTDTFFKELFGEASELPAAGKPAQLTAIGPLVAKAQAEWQGAQVDHLHIHHPNDANASIAMDREGGKALTQSSMSISFNGVTGKVIESKGDEARPVVQTAGVMRSLHEAVFAGPFVRALFFISGLGGCLMIASGALLWAIKKRQSQAKLIAETGRVSAGLRLVEALNIGVIAGLPIAFASYFWANRLIPVGIPLREELEIHCFFIAWACALALAQYRPQQSMWQLQLWVGAILMVLLPVLNALTTDSHLGVTLLHGPFAVAGFDLTVLALGVGLGFAAWKTGNKKNSPKKISAEKSVKSSKVPADKHATSPAVRSKA